MILKNRNPGVTLQSFVDAVNNETKKMQRKGIISRHGKAWGEEWKSRKEAKDSTK